MYKELRTALFRRVAFTAAVAVLMLGGHAAPALARADLDAILPGIAVENDAQLLIALPLHNAGDSGARSVIVSQVRLRGGERSLPTDLPVLLGTIKPDDRTVLNLRFDVSMLNVSHVYQLEIAGRFQDIDPFDPSGDTDDRNRAREFRLLVPIHIPPTAPGSASTRSNSGPSKRTSGPYPALPQPPQTEGNEARPPTPQGSELQTFPLTRTGSLAQKPQGGAAVGITVNTQTGGIANRFPPDPSGAAADGGSKLVITTGNLYVKYSTDGGSNFTTISNLSTVFGDQPDGGYCCDQVVHYLPGIDRIVWLIQTNQATDASGAVTGPNRLRIAWARPSDVAANFYTAWTWFDVTSSFLGLGNDWLDFPDLSTASNHLYASVDDVTKGGLVVFRISYSDVLLPAGNTVTWDFTDPTKATSAVASHLTQNATGTMYWAGHNSTKQIRVFSWGDASNQYSWTDVDNTSYSTGDYTSQAPDGQYWLDPRPKGDAILGAAVVPFRGLVSPGGAAPADRLWFAWTAGRDSTFPQPQIRFAMIDSAKFNETGELQVWNSDYAFAYPALAVDASTAEVAISLMWGGNDKFYMNHAVGFLGDFIVYTTTTSNVTLTADPATSTACDDASGGKVSGRCTRSGDYLSLRRVGSNPSLFGTVGYEVNLVDPTTSTDCLTAPGCVQNERWIEFGRPVTELPPIR